MRRATMLALLLVGCGGGADNGPLAPAGDSSTGDSSTSDTAPSEDRPEPEDAEPPPGDGTIFPVEDAMVFEDAPPDAPIPADYPLPAVPSTCPRTARVITYDPNGWGAIADAFEENVSPCADYLIHLPALVSDKTYPRGPLQPATIRARKGRFFAVAEFHFGAWSARTDLTWYAKGVEFRKRMTEAGYNIPRGDTWAINELPSTVRTDPAVRTNVRELVRGLYTGTTPRSGIVFVINMGHETTNLTTYKTNLRGWLSDSAFWTDMGRYVRHWGQEAYTSATRVCVPSMTVAARANRVNDFVMHPGRHAQATGAPLSTGAARTFYDAAYFPLMTAYWKSVGPYGNTDVSLDEMKHHVSLQTYSVRLWLETHNYPDGRIGFAWDESAGSATERIELATRLASSIRDAYAPGATASRACSSTGAFTWCDCSVAGATFNDVWDTFATW